MNKQTNNTTAGHQIREPPLPFFPPLDDVKQADDRMIRIIRSSSIWAFDVTGGFEQER